MVELPMGFENLDLDLIENRPLLLAKSVLYKERALK
jgi:hypothetical protein